MSCSLAQWYPEHLSTYLVRKCKKEAVEDPPVPQIATYVASSSRINSFVVNGVDSANYPTHQTEGLYYITISRSLSIYMKTFSIRSSKLVEIS